MSKWEERQKKVKELLEQIEEEIKFLIREELIKEFDSLLNHPSVYEPFSYENIKLDCIRTKLDAMSQSK